jgi:hypothetical protein
MTAIEIIDETIEFYSKNQRAIVGYGACVYNGPDGTHCAFGRCMLPNLQSLGDKLQGNGATLKSLLLRNEVKLLDDLLQPQYRGHSFSFWTNLQVIHDSSDYWCEKGLTTNGVFMVDRLRKRIISGDI